MYRGYAGPAGLDSLPEHLVQRIIDETLDSHGADERERLRQWCSLLQTSQEFQKYGTPKNVTVPRQLSFGSSEYAGLKSWLARHGHALETFHFKGTPIEAVEVVRILRKHSTQIHTLVLDLMPKPFDDADSDTVARVTSSEYEYQKYLQARDFEDLKQPHMDGADFPPSLENLTLSNCTIAGRFNPNIRSLTIEDNVTICRSALPLPSFLQELSCKSFPLRAAEDSDEEGEPWEITKLWGLTDSLVSLEWRRSGMPGGIDMNAIPPSIVTLYADHVDLVNLNRANILRCTKLEKLLISTDMVYVEPLAFEALAELPNLKEVSLCFPMDDRIDSIILPPSATDAEFWWASGITERTFELTQNIRFLSIQQNLDLNLLRLDIWNTVENLCLNAAKLHRSFPGGAELILPVTRRKPLTLYLERHAQGNDDVVPDYELLMPMRDIVQKVVICAMDADRVEDAESRILKRIFPNADHEWHNDADLCCVYNEQHSVFC